MNKVLLVVFTAFFCFSSCQIENIDYLVPVLNTFNGESIYTDSAHLYGEVVSEGGKEIFEYGFVLSESDPPTISDSKYKLDTRIIGSFDYITSELDENTTYYYSSYAINEIGVGYGEVVSFKTLSGPKCSPKDNFFEFDDGEYQLNIDLLSYAVNTTNNPLYSTGNLGVKIYMEPEEFNDSFYMYVDFNEEFTKFPESGEYKIVQYFDDSKQSINEVEVTIADWDEYFRFYPKIGNVVFGQKIFVENIEGTLSVVFCDIETSSGYKINGKLNYKYDK